MDGQLILGIVVGVIALMGQACWLAFWSGTKNQEIKVLKETVDALRITVNLIGPIVPQVKQIGDDIELIKGSLFRRAQAELVSKGWGGFGP